MSEIKNRIIGSGIVPLDQILFNPRNWRVHPLNQQNALKGVLEEVGWVQEVIINQRTGHLVDGHLRCQLAAREGAKDIPVKYVDLSEDEEALVLATIDPIAAMAVTDKQKLDELFAGINSENEHVNKMLDEIAEKERLEYGKKEVDAEPQIDRAAELNEKWQVVTGDLWQIGEHRLLCGDSTKREDVERVMGGEKARLVFTSPPYNSAMGGLKPDYYGKQDRFYQDKNIDKKTKEEWLAFCDSVLINCSEFVFDDSVIAWNVMYNANMRDAYGLSMFCGKHPFTVKETICWDKTKGFNIATKRILSRTWEFIFILSMVDEYFTTQKENEVRYALWRIGTDDTQIKGVHHAAFPVGLPKQAIEWFSIESDIIYDPFVGSGTTMVACENLRRKCRAIEISPNYCAVILERMHTAFPELEIKRL